RGRRGVQGEVVDAGAGEQFLQGEFHAGGPGDGGLEFDGGQRVQALPDERGGRVDGDAEAARGQFRDDGTHPAGVQSRGRGGRGLQGEVVDAGAGEQFLQGEFHAGGPGDGGLEFDGGQRVQALPDERGGRVDGDAEAARGQFRDDGTHPAGVQSRGRGGRGRLRLRGAGVRPAHHGQGAVGEGRAGGGALDLPARGAGDGAGAHQGDGPGSDVVLPHEGGADRADHGVGGLRDVA